MPDHAEVLTNRENLIPRWIPFLIFALAITARLLPGARTIDDSFITYRYVRNILAGNGFVYNPGERVLGTTTPFYTILLTSAGVFGGGVEANFPQISLLINAFADGVTCLLFLQLGRRLGAKYAGIGAGLVWAIAPFSVTFAIGGLETSVYVLLLVATISAYLSSANILAALLAALMYLTRPDALILIGPLALDRFLQLYRHPENRPSRQKISYEMLAFLLPTIAWTLFASIYFGSPLPHSISAKSVAYLLPENSAFIRLLQHYSTIFLGHLTFGLSWIKVGFILYPFLYLIGALHAFRVSRNSWPFLVYPWLYLITFSIANPLIFRWYMTPPLPALMLVVLIGMEKLLLILYDLVMNRKSRTTKTLAEPQNQGSLHPFIPIFFVIILPIALSLRDWQLRPDHGLARPAPAMAWYLLELRYRQATELLLADFSTTPEEITVAAGDVGVLGYYTGARILDTVGLNSPKSTKFYPLAPSAHANAYAISPDLILDEQPDYLVFLEVYGRNSLLKDEPFLNSYQLIHLIPTDIYNSVGMLIYKRITHQ